ncbi:MAG TPA: NDP-hexose 4-ketoreductase, partial [Anaerolineae bacterium]|nr:NDP-hexose 4-ketoreductase [Anaerolineae bacterium]
MAGTERFTQRARRVLSLAHQEAEKTHQRYIGTEHLLLGLLEEDGGVAGRVLRELGLESGRVREMVSRISVDGDNMDVKIELAPDTQKVLGFAVEEAQRLSHQYVGTEHLLLGLVRTDGAALEVLNKLGVTPDQVRRQTRRILHEGSSNAVPEGSIKPASKNEPKTPLVDQLAVDLTTLAEQDKLDPVIGR